MKKSARVYDKICESSINLNLRNTTKKGVLKELVSLLSMDSREKDILIKTLIKREELGSTGVGNGIAIPHARTLLVRECTLVIGLSRKGIRFGSFDDKAVQLFFLIVAPPQEISNSYLITLGKIAELARGIAKDKRLFGVKKEGEFLKIIKEIEEGGE